MLNDTQEYIVQLTVTSVHEYVVDATSEAEAVAIAEGRFEDEEFGVLVSFDVETADGYPTEEEINEYPDRRNNTRPTLSQYDGDEEFD